MDSEPAVIETAPVTDLVLVVGPSKERIPVESAILKAASPVFTSMFSPPWLESQSKEIPLPEDDQDAMRFITLTLSYHNEHELVTRPRTPQEILQIAIAVDKYDLRTALKFVLDFLFREASKTCPVAKNEDGSQTAMAGEDIVYLCAAAYVLDWCEHFSRFALDLICCQMQSFTILMDDQLIRSIMPEKFFVMLAEKLAAFQLGICRVCRQCATDRRSYHACYCAWSHSLRERFEQLTVKFGRPNENGMRPGLLSTIETLRRLFQEDISWSNVDCTQYSKPHSKIIMESLTFSHMVQKEESLHLHFCVHELKNKDDCNAAAKHAKLTVTGPTI